MQAAIGFKARTGRAIAVVITGDRHSLSVLQRHELPLLPPGEMAPYHVASELPPPAAREHLRQALAATQRLAAQGLAGLTQALEATGHRARTCGLLTGPGMPAWSMEQILSVHVRMHQAEGEWFRHAVHDAAQALGLVVRNLPEKTALASAAEALGQSTEQLEQQIAHLGRAAGPPWTLHHKEAAAAALVALLGRA